MITGAVVWESSGPPIIFWFLFFTFMLLGIASFALWIWALVDAVRVPDDRFYRAGTKLVWVLVIVLLQLIGAVVYLAVGRPERSVRAAWSGDTAPPAPPVGHGALPPPPP